MILDTVQEASEEPPEPAVQMLCCERAPKRLSSPNVPATAIPVRVMMIIFTLKPLRIPGATGLC